MAEVARYFSGEGISPFDISSMLNDGDKIYFTGMSVQSQFCFRVKYIYPASRTICNYYSDFLVIREDDSTHLVEVKSGWKSNDRVVMAKREAAKKLAEGNFFHDALVTKDDFDIFINPETRRACVEPNTYISVYYKYFWKKKIRTYILPHTFMRILARNEDMLNNLGFILLLFRQ